MRKLSVLLSIGIIIASAIPMFAQDSISGGIAPILIEITGVLTYEDVDNNGLREVVVDGVVIAPPAGFSSGDFQEGQLVTVAGYLLEDDTIEATSFMLAKDDVQATVEPTPVESNTGQETEDQDDKAQDEQEREDEKREEEREREEEKREEEQEREDEKREDEREREDEKREDKSVVEVSGEVTAVTQNYIVVEGVEVSAGGSFQPSHFKVGQKVTVTGIYENNGMLRAISIEEMADTEEVTESESASESAEIPACIKENHPVVKTLAKEFDTEASTIIDLYCAGNGFGDIARALLLSAKTGETPETYLDKLNNGQDWGQIARDAGFEPSDVSPERVLDGKK